MDTEEATSRQELMVSKFSDDILRDVPRGATSRRLGQQARPQARWQDPEKSYASQILAYDPKNPGSKLRSELIFTP